MTKGLTKIGKELAHHEAIIDDGMKGFLHVGRSLIAIRDGQLYSETYDTFEAYCEKRWGFKKSQAYRLIEAATVVAEVSEMSPIGDTKTKDSKQKTQIPVPQNEAQARALAGAGDTPEERREVWTKAVETAPRNESGEPVITAKHIAKVADEVVGPKNDAKPNPQPAQETPVAAAEQPDYGGSFNPTEFDPELNPDLQRVSVARLPIEEKLVEQPKMIEAFCRAVRKHFEDNLPTDPLLDEGTLNIVGQQLTSMLNTLRQRKAYGRCPKCPETINPKCGFCKGHGYVTKTTFESAGGVK